MPAVRFTYEDLRLFPDDHLRRELMEGEVHVAPAPNVLHQRIVARLLLAIGHFLREHPLGEVLVAPVDVIFSPRDDVLEPDILYVAAERLDIIGERGVEGAPDWVIEVTSPSTRQRDFTIKRKLYQKYAVRLYWVVDPEAGMVHAWEAGEHQVYEYQAYGEGETLTVSFLPGLGLPVAEVLAR